MLKRNCALAFILVIATSVVAVSCNDDNGEGVNGGLDSGGPDASEQETSPLDTGVDTGNKDADLDTGDKDVDVDTGDKDATQEDGAATDVEKPNEICTGSPTKIVLSARKPALGMLSPELQFVARNGIYVLVTGDCTVHCGTIEGQVYTTKFDEDRVTKLFTDVEVDLVDERAGQYEGDCYDVPSTIISYNGKSIELHRCAGEKEAKWIPKLVSATSQWYESCVKEAKPVTGDMRYTVYEKSDGFGPDYHPVEWPLEVSLKSVLEGADLQKGYVAKDKEATKLRDLRGKALQGELGPEKTFWIPVNDANKSYSLYVSDTCVLEDSNGKIPF